MHQTAMHMAMPRARRVLESDLQQRIVARLEEISHDTGILAKIAYDEREEELAERQPIPEGKRRFAV